MENKSQFLITKSDKKQRLNLWNAEAEALIVLLSIKITEIRKGHIASEIVKELNYKYLRKTFSENPREDIKKYSATPFQRALLNNSGY